MQKYDSPVMTLKETADYLRVHPSTIYRLLKAGALPSLRIGSDWRFIKADLDDWLKKQAEYQRGKPT